MIDPHKEHQRLLRIHNGILPDNNRVCRLNRRAFLRTGSAAALTLALSGTAGAGVPQKRPNIVVALADDLGYGDLGCYGHPTTLTPNIDRLAAEGMRFTDCYAGAPVCSPSRAAMLTGRTPHRCGIYDWIPENSPMHLRREEITVASLLKKAGYATCHVGKWHLNGVFNSPDQPQPGDYGFDYWFATQNNAHPSHLNPDNFVRNGVPAGRIEGFSPEIIVDEAVAWLTSYRDGAKPFCLFVWFHSPHEPIATADEFMKPYEGAREAVYYGNVTQMDHAFGRLMDTLDSMGVRDETFIFFTSDNGPETLNRYVGSERSFGSPGPLRGMKLHLYEGGIRVPGIVRWPGTTTSSTVSREPICFTDILPTLCSMAGITAPDDRTIDGAVITPVFGSGAVTRTVPLYWRYDNALSKPYTAALRRGDWKILSDQSLNTFELYNVRIDFGEKDNRAESDAERLREMRDILTPLHSAIDREGPTWPARRE